MFPLKLFNKSPSTPVSMKGNALVHYCIWPKNC